jgi:hypothetical protein
MWTAKKQSPDRAELHLLATLVDELESLLVRGVMDRGQLQAIENAVSKRIGTEPRNW